MGDEFVSTEHLLLSLARRAAKSTSGASRDQLAEAVSRCAAPTA